jgi:hypothetical protein
VATRFFLAAFLSFLPSVPAQEAPYAIAPLLFDMSRPDDLGLKPAPGAQTFTVFRAAGEGNAYANGVALIGFQGKLYAQWQASPKDEDSAGTHVLYAVSDDGEHWSAPRLLADAGATIRTSGGWHTDGKTLVAYINEWNGDLRTGGMTLARTSADGLNWSKPVSVRDADGKPVSGVIEQDTRALPEGRLVTAFHLQPGLKATPFYTDDPLGLNGWREGIMPRLPHDGKESRELEPSWFRRPDGGLVMVFRDQAGSFRQLASQSRDQAETWSLPALTGMPDSRSKQSAGNLPDGSAFLINAPSGTKLRSPLVLTLSRDGRIFDKAYLLRAGPPPSNRFPGHYKRPGYHYPKATLWGGFLYVGYASSKEDVVVTRVPLAGLH